MRASQFPPTSSFRRQHRHHRPKHFVSSVSGTCSMCKRRSVTRRFSPSPSHLVLTTRGGWTMSIFLSAAPVQGKWVVIKCDSGPGRLNPDLLAYLHYHGFLLYPGVPNTTAVSQETDQSFGPFQSAVRTNLQLLIDERICKDAPDCWPCGLRRMRSGNRVDCCVGV